MVDIKSKRLNFILVVTIILLLVGCGNLQGDKEKTKYNERISSYSEKVETLIVEDYNGIELDKINQYVIDIEFLSEEKYYKGKQKTTYVNNESVQLKEIYFHIYPNTFRKKETAPFLFDSFENAYPDGFKPGYIDFNKITINEKEIDNYTMQGRGDTILKIPLDKPINPGEKVDIYMEYEVVMPPAQDRFGYGEKTFNFGNWYPIAAVYDDEGWNLDPYYSIGDPFYSDTSNYEVTIKTPKNIIIATSGNVLSEETNGDFKTWKIEAKLMRDFAWVASEHFKKTENKVGETIVKMYFLDDNEEINKFASEVSYSSIEIFNKTFGKYPYGQYSVVATSFPSGMEYPGIVFIGEKYYDKSYKGYLEIVIAHETAHQWWYGVVGNDEIDEAWLDEGITTYSEVIYAEEKYGNDTGDSYYSNNIENGYENRRPAIQSNEVILKSLDQFSNWNEYGSLVYNKAAMFIHEIEEKYGEEILYKILRKYYDEFSFLNATSEDFIAICEEVTGEEFDKMVNKWLYGR